MASSGEPLVYLDHAATTPVRPEVAEAMAPFGAERFANPAAGHSLGRDARKAVEEAREQVAGLSGADPGDVVFTSGGTESDNLAVFGVLDGAEGSAAVAVCSAIEHPAVLEPLRAAARRAARGWGRPLELREVPATADGTIDLSALEAALDTDTRLVSVMAANNEVGTLQPLGHVTALVRARAPGAVLHTDAVQAARFLDLAEATAGCDLVSISGHKLGGPKGVGALVARGVGLAPLLYGGGQERERRSGTTNVAGVVGLAAALRAVAANREAEAARVATLRDRLADGLTEAVPGLLETVPRGSALPGHCHVRVRGVDHEELLLLLDAARICASGGSACASGALEPSHVLLAMGLDTEAARSGIRFSLGHTSTEEDVDRAVAAVAAAVVRLSR